MKIGPGTESLKNPYNCPQNLPVTEANNQLIVPTNGTMLTEIFQCFYHLVARKGEVLQLAFESLRVSYSTRVNLFSQKSSFIDGNNNVQTIFYYHSQLFSRRFSIEWNRNIIQMKANRWSKLSQISTIWRADFEDRGPNCKQLTSLLGLPVTLPIPMARLGLPIHGISSIGATSDELAKVRRALH